MTVISRSQIWDSLTSNPASPKLMIPQTWMPLVLAHMVPGTFELAFSNLTDECLGAPETFRSHKDTESSPLQVTPAVDIWSVGCVFSEVSVWAHHGWKRVVEYRRQRSVEIEDKGGDEGEQTFHFDGKLLDAVDSIHQDIIGKNSTRDHVTRSVLDRLVVDMLQHGSRPTAKFIFEKSKRLITEVEKRFGVSVAGLVGNTNGELINSNGATIRTRTPLQVPNENYRSRAERERLLRGPSPPDDDSPPLSPSLRQQSSPYRDHHKSTSQSSTSRSIDAIESSQNGGQGAHVVSHPPTPPSIAANTHDNSPQQHVLERQEEPVRPTLSIDQGHEWKKKKKNGEMAILPGVENLTSLNQRDHVCNVLPRLGLANEWL